jgi:predicted transposase/invertase (TIGR01784 family)
MTSIQPLISFDYAIKYLLKDKGDYSIVEGFISALLKTIGYKEVKIIALLETESNKEDPKHKRSLADLIVEDQDHQKYIIEIERSVKDSFIHKSCFNTSRLIVDNIAAGQDYTKIVKVFHISLLYFPIGNKGVIYHGKTIIHEVENGERLNVHITNEDTGQTFDATNILPEYFFISIPLFNDRLVKEIDDWLYVMKHDQVPDKPDNFQSPYMKQVAEKLNILKMTQEERDNYAYYQKKLYNDRDELASALRRGKEEGLKEGVEKGKQEGLKEGEQKGKKAMALENAKKMLANNLDPKLIASCTGLALEEIAKLKN